MWFKNIRVFNIDMDIGHSAEKLEASLSQFPKQDVGPMELVSAGWDSPFGHGNDQLVHSVGQCHRICFCLQEKVIPAAVVKEAMEIKLSQLEASEARKPSGKEKFHAKESVLAELLPRAFSRPRRVDAYIDAQRQWLVVDAASTKIAEDVVDLLRMSLGNFKAVPPALSPRHSQLLGEWLANGDGDSGFSLGDKCELAADAQNGAIVRCRNQELTAPEIQQHLKAGKQVRQLGLVWQDRVELVVADDLSLKQIRFTDVVLDEMDDSPDHDVAAELDARFALLSGEIGRLLDALEKCFSLRSSGTF